jgi:hypothetical protein
LSQIKERRRDLGHGADITMSPKTIQLVRPTSLGESAMAEALALVQVTWPGVDSRSWGRYLSAIAQRAKGRSAGGLALRDGAEYLNGLAVYEPEQDLQNGQVLTVHLFTALDLANSATPARVLLDAVIDRAKELDCSGVQIRLYDEQPALRTRLRRFGLVERAGYLWKRIAPVSDPNGSPRL